MKTQQKYPINKQKAVSTKVEESTVEKLLNVDELSEWLGIEKSTIYAWTSKNIIPHIKLGSRLRFRESDIREWLDTKAVYPNSRSCKDKSKRSSVKASATDGYIERIIKHAKDEILH